ncbi:MAG: CHRD domain-containing protein [Methylovirgula sp.]|uniref:CHRD domain-containing protein n=1 Tax=Methylovirgula sp. TaxID=1978224 RepID=UPI0030761F22
MSRFFTRVTRHRNLFVTAAAVTLLGLSPAWAETYNLIASLSGASEVPSNSTKGTGSVTATYDTTTKKLAWTVTYSGLTGTAVAAHFHGPAAPGKDAPVEVPVTIGPSPLQGSATLTPAQEKDLLDGNVYFNIHTQANPKGEIRGQVSKAEPG